MLTPGTRTDLDDNITEVRGRETGTSRAYTKTRLPEDLKSKVTNGALSANAAAIQAGIRKRKVQVEGPGVRRPAKFARALQLTCSPVDQLRGLALIFSPVDQP